MSQRTLSIQAITWIVVLFNAAIEATLPDGCKSRNLSVTADDYLRLYIDGREITGLVNADDWQYPDTVELSCNARVIAIEANNTFQVGAILAYTDDGHIKTNTSWKCTNTSIQGWETVEFNDSSWKNAVLVGYHDDFPEGIRETVREDARWIWTEGYEGQDVNVFCRRKLDIDECSFGQPINECDPSMGRCVSIPSRGYNCSCYHGYTNDGRHKCKDVDECLLGPTGNKCNVSSGSCINTPGSYKCRCYQGFTNAGDQHCEASSDNKTSLIFGVSLGVAFLIVVVLIVALSIVCSRTSKRQDRKVGNKDATRSYIIPNFGNSSTNKPSSPDRTYAQLRLNTMHTLHSTQNDSYEEIIE